MKAKEMREKTFEELDHLLSGWREELFKLGIQSMTGQVEQYNRMRDIRKDIARALTVMKGKGASARASDGGKGRQ